MNREPTDFIGVYDNALSAEFCREIIEMFESFPQIQTAGRIGSGIDTRKKESVDACISEYQEWTPINQRLFDITLEKLAEYVTEHRFLVCGSLAPTIRLESGEHLLQRGQLARRQLREREGQGAPAKFGQVEIPLREAVREP